MRPVRFVLCLVLLSASLANAQWSAGNKYVTVLVKPGNGVITIRIAPGTQQSPILTYPDKSFFTVMVGDKIYTNNNVGTNLTTDPRFGGKLENGINRKVGDTIVTTWPNINGCDVIQEVYPVELEASGQIVMRWKVKNNGTKKVVGASQFLIDLQVGAQHPNDGAALLTRYGYRPIWEQYKSNSQYGIPWFYAAFENELPEDSQSFEPPGITGVGYTHDVNYKLGLKKPSIMTIGDWGNLMGQYALVDFLWGVSGSVPWGSDYKDAAILYQWDTVGIGASKTVELARTSLGTGEFGVCKGQIFGVVFYPRHFDWTGSKYTPDTGTVEFYAYNVYSPLPADANYGPPSTNTHLKLHVGPNLRIVWPDTGRSLDNKNQRQQTEPVGYIPQYGVGTAIWKVVADKVNCINDEVNSWLKFHAQSSLDGTGPIFSNSGDKDTCEHIVVIDCGITDTLSPIVESLDTSKTYQLSFSIRDDRTIDTGIDSVKVIVRPDSGVSAAKFTINTLPDLTHCSKLSHKITITQLDSTAGACFDFTIIDCMGNETTRTFCLESHPFIMPPDTLPPVITVIRRIRGTRAVAPCDGLCDSILVTDSREFDRGLREIIVLTSNNMQIAFPNIQIGADSIRGIICVTDSLRDASISIRATDSVGNITDTTFCYDVIEGSVDELRTESFELIGNPASDKTFLRVNLAAAQNIVIRVIDIVGREVHVDRQVLPAGMSDITLPTTGLIEGTYYIIAEFGGRQYAKKMQVVR